MKTAEEMSNLFEEIKNNLSRSLWMSYKYRIDELSNFCLAIDEDFETGEVIEIDLVTLESYLRCSGYKVTSQIHKDKMRVYIEY